MATLSSRVEGKLPFFLNSAQVLIYAHLCSFSGYLTARILADYFENVIIVEVDTRLELYGSRIGQRNQFHGYLAVALEIFRALFPDFDSEVQKTGGV